MRKTKNVTFYIKVIFVKKKKSDIYLKNKSNPFNENFSDLAYSNSKYDSP